MPIQNAEIAAMFDQMADLLEIQGGNPFRARAYRKAARTIETLPKSAAALIAAGEDLSELPGIGKDLATKIGEIAASGRFKMLQSLKRRLPGELGEMAAVPGLGAEAGEASIRSPAHSHAGEAAACGALRPHPRAEGLWREDRAKILAALEKPIVTRKRFKLPVAEEEAQALIAHLKPSVGKGEITVAGSYRRRRETVGDLDIVATAGKTDVVGDRLIAYENVAEVLAHGATRTTIVLRSGIQVDLRVVPAHSYGAALLYFTGSKSAQYCLARLGQ